MAGDRPADDAPLIVFDGFGFTHDGTERPALAGIDLVIRRGEYVGLIGLNGAGKSTLGLTLNGVVPHLLPGSLVGTLRVAGRDPATSTVREMARTVGVVFDDPEAQVSQLTVADEVAFGLENLGVDPHAMDARIAEALRAVGLDGLEERSPWTLSGGQQQRLAIASVLAMRPMILFLDEPTSNLDPTATTEVLEIVRRRHAEEGLTVLVAEHDVEALAEAADRIVVLDAGRVVLDGPTREVLGRVDDLRALGLRPPAVTEVAAALGGDAGATGLPVTEAQALAWFGARR